MKKYYRKTSNGVNAYSLADFGGFEKLGQR